MVQPDLALATVHTTQLTNNNTKSDWSLQLNGTNEEIFTLPKALTDSQVFSIIDFVKKYELIAFNEGIMFQKGKQNEVLKNEIDEHMNIRSLLEEENARLSSVVETLSTGVQDERM